MHLAARLAAAAAVLISLAVGVTDTLDVLATRPVEPRWAELMIPLRSAPLAEHEVVALVLPRGLSQEQAKNLLFEAAWQRPGIRWTPTDDPAGAGAGAALTLADAPPPPGWSEAWRLGDVALWRRSRP